MINIGLFYDFYVTNFVNKKKRFIIIFYLSYSLESFHFSELKNISYHVFYQVMNGCMKPHEFGIPETIMF